MNGKFDVEGVSTFTPPRRQFLTGLAALAAGVLVPEHLLAQQAPRTSAGLGWIDVHHHFSPAAYAEVTTQKKILPKPLVGWSPEETIEDIDRAGVATAMNSDRKSTRLNSSHQIISYAVFCLKKK